MTQPMICDSNKKRPSVPGFCDFGEWEVSVNSLMDIKEPNRDHAYVLPDDSVWVLNHEGTGFLQLNISLNSKGDPGPKGEKGERGETGQQGETAYFYTAWSNSIDGFDDFTTTLEPPRPNMLENTDFKTAWQRSSLIESEIKYESNVVRIEKKESQKNRSILYLPITTSFLELGVCYATAIEVYLESGDLGANTNIFFRNTAPNQSDVALTKIPNTIPKNQWVRLAGFSEECNHLPSNLDGCFFGIGISADFVGVVKFRRPKMEKDIPISNQTSQYILHVNDEDYQPFEAKFAYMGTLATTEKIPSKDYKDYQWSKIVGDTGEQGLKGDKGDVGAQGPKGDKGDTGAQGIKGENAYLHMAWSNSCDGFDDFTTTLEPPRPNMLENTDFKKAWQRSTLTFSEVTYSNGNEVRIEKTEPNANGYRSALYLPITTKFLEIGERYAISIEVYLESGDLGSNTNTYFRNNATKHFDVAIAKIPNDIPKNQWVRITGSSEECKDLPTDLSNCYFGIGITKDFVGAVRFRRPKMEKMCLTEKLEHHIF